MQEGAVGLGVTAGAQAVAAFVGYLVVVLGIGVYAARFRPPRDARALLESMSRVPATDA